MFRLQPACPLFLHQTRLHPHWPPPFLKGMALHLSPWQPIQGHRIAHRGLRPWRVTVAHHIEPCLLTPSPPHQRQTRPPICHRMASWKQMSLIHTINFNADRASQNFRSVHVFCECVGLAVQVRGFCNFLKSLLYSTFGLQWKVTCTLQANHMQHL